MEVLVSPEQVAPRSHRLPHDENMLANFEEEEEKVLSTRPSASNDDTHRGVLEAVEETLNSTNPFVGNGEASDLSAATPTAAAQDAENSPNNTSSTSGVVAKAQDRQRGHTDRTAITASSASSSYTASSSVTSSSSARSASSSSTASASSVSTSSASDNAHPQHHHKEIKKKPSVHTSHAGEGQHNGVSQPDRAQEAEKSNSNSANAQNTPEHTAAATVVSVNITATTPDAGPHPVTVVRLAPHVLAPSQDFAEAHNTRTLLAHHHTSPKRLQGQPILAPIAAAPDAPSLPSLIAAGPLPSQRVPQPTAQRSLVRTDDDTKRMTQEMLKDRNVNDAPTAEQVTRQQTRSSSSDSEVSRRAAGAMALKTQSDLASTLAQIRRNLTEGLDTSEEDYRDETENDDADGEGHDNEKEDEDAMPVPRRDVPQRVQYHARRSASASSSSAASARSDGTAERHQAQPKRHDDEVVHHHHRPHSDHPSIATDDGEEEQYDNYDDDDDYYYEDMDDAEEDEEEEDEEEPHIDIIEGTGHGALMTEILYGTPSASAVVPVATRRDTKHRDDAFLHSVQENTEEERYEEKEIGERKATAPDSGESDSEEDNTTAPHRRRTRTPERVARPLLQSTAGHYEDYEASYHEATEMANKEENEEEDAEKAVYAHGEPFTEAVPRPIQSSAPSDFDEDDDEEEDVDVIDAGEVRHAHRSAGVRPLGRRETRHRASGHPSQVHKAHRTNDNIHHHYHRRVAPPAAPPTPHDVAYRAESEEKEGSAGRGVVPPQPKKKEEEEEVLDLMQGGSAYSADDERAPPSPPHNGQLQLPPAEATHAGNATPNMNVMVLMLRESSTTQPAANVSAALLPSSQAEMTIPPISDAVAEEGKANPQTAIPLPNAPETSTPAVATTEPVTAAEGVGEASHATTAPAAVVNEVQTSTAPVTEAAAVEAAPVTSLPPQQPQAETNAPTTVAKASGAPTTAEPKKRGVWARLRHYFTGKDKPTQKKGASHPNNNTAGAPKETMPKTKKKKSMSSPLNLCKKDTTVAKKNQPSATAKPTATPPKAEAPAKAQEPTTTPPKADEAPSSTTPVPLPEPSHQADAVEAKEEEVSAAAPGAETVKEAAAAAPPQTTTTTTTTAANAAGAPLVTVAVTVQQPTQQAQPSLQLTPVSSALHATTPPVSHISPSSPPLLLQDAATPGADGQSAQEDIMKKKKNRSEAESESASTSSAGAKYRHHHSRPRRRGQRRGQRRYRARSPVDDVDEQSQDARRSEDDDEMDDDAAYRHGVRTPQKEDIDITPFRKHRVHRQHRRRVSSRPHGLVASHDKMRALE